MVAEALGAEYRFENRVERIENGNGASEGTKKTVPNVMFNGAEQPLTDPKAAKQDFQMLKTFMGFS